MMMSSKKNQIYIVLFFILSLLILLFRVLPYQIGVNLTDSLPQKIFLVQKGVFPQRNDYVVFNKANKWYKRDFVKQVIGVEGDEIKHLENKVWILSKENQIIQAGVAKPVSLKGEFLTRISPTIIAKGYYFVHAPHKDSLDSRYADIGLISTNEIIGKATPISGYVLLTLLLIFSIALFLLSIEKLTTKSKSIKLILFLSFLLFSKQQSFAKDLGVQGAIYPIKETDLAENIKTKLNKLEKSGKLAQLQKQWQEKTIATTNRPKPVDGLHKTIKVREFIFDPTITLKQDITDHKGNLIAPKGKKVNPLDYHSLPENLLFIDGDDKKQVVWAKKQAKIHSSMIILTKGAIIDLMKSEKIRFYFDQDGFLIRTFGIKAVPAIVYQEGKVLKIREEMV
jgi:conjugal transfer pilus assembly protein TraW